MLSTGTGPIIEANANKAMFAGPGGWNDLDFVMTGGQGCRNGEPLSHCPGQTDTEYRTEFSIWTIVASPILVATDVRNMSILMTEILLNADIIAVHQDKLGKAGGRIGYSKGCAEGPTYCQIWARPLHDGSYAVGLYNSGSMTNNITLPFDMVGFNGNVTLYDLWAHKHLGSFSSSYTVEVESHGTAFYKIKKY